jgi:hypothetical protein
VARGATFDGRPSLTGIVVTFATAGDRVLA